MAPWTKYEAIPLARCAAVSRPQPRPQLHWNPLVYLQSRAKAARKVAPLRYTITECLLRFDMYVRVRMQSQRSVLYI